jgi:hypothetical protein
MNFKQHWTKLNKSSDSINDLIKLFPTFSVVDSDSSFAYLRNPKVGVIELRVSNALGASGRSTASAIVEKFGSNSKTFSGEPSAMIGRIKSYLNI